MHPRYICFRRSDAFTTTSPEIGRQIIFQRAGFLRKPVISEISSEMCSSAAPLVPSTKCGGRSNAAHLAERIFFEQILLPRNQRRYYHLVTGASFVLFSCLFSSLSLFFSFRYVATARRVMAVSLLRCGSRNEPGANAAINSRRVTPVNKAR